MCLITVPAVNGLKYCSYFESRGDRWLLQQWILKRFLGWISKNTGVKIAPNSLWQYNLKNQYTLFCKHNLLYINMQPFTQLYFNSETLGNFFFCFLCFVFVFFCFVFINNKKLRGWPWSAFYQIHWKVWSAITYININIYKKVNPSKWAWMHFSTPVPRDLKLISPDILLKIKFKHVSHHTHWDRILEMHGTHSKHDSVWKGNRYEGWKQTATLIVSFLVLQIQAKKMKKGKNETRINQEEKNTGWFLSPCPMSCIPHELSRNKK